MTAKQCRDSETNIKVEKQPNGRVRVVIEELSIAGNMMDVEEGVLQYLNQAGTAIIKEALQQHDVEGDPLVWDSRCQALILKQHLSSFLSYPSYPFVRPPAEPILSSRPAVSWSAARRVGQGWPSPSRSSTRSHFQATP